MKEENLFLSGLKSSSRNLVGKTLVLRTEVGWGWIRKIDSRILDVTEPEIVNAKFSVVPEWFFSYETPTRGFVGHVTADGSLFDKNKIIALTMSDGIDFDFEDTICPAWRIYIGQGKVIIKSNKPSICGNDVYSGYGVVTKVGKLPK